MKFSFALAILAALVSAALPTLTAQPAVALVRHAPSLGGTVEGSVQQLTAESVTLNGGTVITEDLLVPGAPTLRLNGNPAFGGTVVGNGAATPAGYTVTLSGNARLRYLRTRLDPVALPAVAAPPAPAGTRSVSINNSSQSPGDFATLRHLTLNGNFGSVAVPPGVYGDFTANGGSGFTLGVAGATTPAVYAFQRLKLNGNSSFVVVGPVVVTIADSLSANSSLGAPARPDWFVLQISSGGLTLNGQASFFGYVTAPAGTVTLNGQSLLVGGVACDRLSLGGNSILRLVPRIGNQPPTVELTLPLAGTLFNAPATIPLAATASDPDGTVAKVEFFQGASKLGEALATPFAFTWTGMLPGSYALSAKATDNLGASAATGATLVTVQAPLPQTINFEAAEGYQLGPLLGQGGWMVAGTADVTDVAAYRGARAVILAATSPATAISYSFPAAIGQPLVFVDAFTKLIVGGATASGSLLVAEAAQVTLLAAAAEGEVAVLNGDGFGSGIWQRTGFKTALTPAGQTVDWLRVSVRKDFVAKKWDLSINGRMVAADLGFVDFAPTAFSRFAVTGATAAPTLLDDLLAGFDNPLFPDADKDGMDDAWETANGLNPIVNDRNADRDADGLSNLREFILGTRADRADSDGDGIPDGLEVSLGLNPLAPNPDTTPPTAPTNLAATQVAATSVALAWQPASDNILVAGYAIYRNGARLAPPALVTATVFTDTGLLENTPFTYEIRALDLAGNVSPPSNAVTGTTAIIDQDANGLPDSWERRYFNRTGVDPAADDDGDGLSNLSEFQGGTDPTDFYNGVSPQIETLHNGRPGPNDELAMLVKKPDGTPWPNAPVTFDITGGYRRISATRGGPVFDFYVRVRADATGLARAYLEAIQP